MVVQLVKKHPIFMESTIVCWFVCNSTLKFLVHFVCFYRTILIANNISQLNKESTLLITREDIQKCKKLARNKNVDIFELLSKSLAPSIHGHDYIKKAILCMLLGGVEKVLPNGTRLRG